MPVLPYVANLARVSILQRHFDQEIVNVTNWTMGGSWDATDLLGLCEAIRDAWEGSVLLFQSYQLTVTGIEGRGQRFPGDVGADVSVFPAMPGENATDSANPQNACVVSLRTARIGRSYRGRAFIGGLPNNQVVAGLIPDPHRNGLASAYKGFLDNVTIAVGWTPVIVSYYHEGAVRTDPVVTPISAALSRTAYPAVQRRRRATVGS